MRNIQYIRFLYYMQIYPWNIYQLLNEKIYYYTESFVNIHEEARRDHWIPFAFMPIAHVWLRNEQVADSGLWERLCEGNEIIVHCTTIAGGLYWDAQNNRSVSFGNCSRHQVFSFLGWLLGDRQVHIVHILHIMYQFVYFTYYVLNC